MSSGRSPANADADREDTFRPQNSALTIFLSNRVLGALVLPANRQYPPAFPVIEKLKAVDAAHKRLGIARIMTRFVRAPNVSNPAKLFGSPSDLFFVKAVLQKRFDAGNITFDV